MAALQCAKKSPQLAVLEAIQGAELCRRFLEPTLRQVEQELREAYDIAAELCEDAYRWITGADEEKDELPETSVQLASREMAYLSGFSTVCSMIPSSSSSALILSSVNIGPFTWFTFGLSGATALYLLTQSVRFLFLNSEHNGRRNVYRAAAAATAIAAAGQVSFLVLNHTAVVQMHLLPFVTVSNFFAPMMNPFIVLHLFTFSTELPLVFYVQGRMAGLENQDVRYSHLNAGLFGVLSILSASTKNVYVRLALLTASCICTMQIREDMKELPGRVKDICPSRTVKIWENNLKFSTQCVKNVALLHPFIQALGPGYFDIVCQATQMDVFALLDMVLIYGGFKKLLQDHCHVSRAEMCLIERQAAKPRAGHESSEGRRPG